MFAVVDAVLLNPLPYPNGDRLRELFIECRRRRTATGTWMACQSTAIRDQTAVFAAVERLRDGRRNADRRRS